MNVLIYAGSASPSPAANAIHSALTPFLSRAYDLKLASDQLLLSQPWQRHTSLIVLPNHSQAEHNLSSDASRRAIRDWASGGGPVLGLGAGVRLAGLGQLGLVPVSWHPIEQTLPEPPAQHASTDCKTSVSLLQPACTPPSTIELILDPLQPLYEAALEQPPPAQLTVLAHLSGTPDRILALQFRDSGTNIVLVGFDVSQNAGWLVQVLSMLDLERVHCPVASEVCSPIYMASCLPSLTVRQTHDALLARCGPDRVLIDTHDSFVLTSPNDSNSPGSPDPPLASSLRLLPWPREDVTLPTPISFDWTKYSALLQAPARSNVHPSPVGATVLFAETVTSTQTVLEKNATLADALPSGTVAIARTQTHGRGRGANKWVSSGGGVQFSVLLKLAGPGCALVFVQYLFGLAVVEWLASRFGGALAVRLKWPNDIYGSVRGHALSDYRKLGGVLVNCSFGGKSGTECRLVIGCGLNHQSAPQSTATCLKDLILASNPLGEGSVKYTVPETEEIIAGILSTFGDMWTRFQVQGFDPFLALYLKHWLHSGQLIKHEPTGEDLRVIGLSPSHGLLRTEKVSSPNNEIVDLQPDSNSFDMFSGLIRSKG